MTKKAKIINVVSGKGGTGKTLFLAVLAQSLGMRASVLVIDLDIFVRGLSAVYDRSLNWPKRLMTEDRIPVSDFFRFKNNLPAFTEKLRKEKKKPGIQTYGSYHIWPAVTYIDYPFRAEDLIPNNLLNAINLIESLLDFVEKDYDYIFLDNRAGFDELIAAAHLVSTCSLCVDEDDSIANITADILIEHLNRARKPRTDPSYDTILDALSKTRDLIYTCMKDVCPVSENNIPSEKMPMMGAYHAFTNASDNFYGELHKIKPEQDAKLKDTIQLRVDNEKKVYRIFNKCRDYPHHPPCDYGVFIGAIPFDADVMENFGENTFDANLNRSTYKEAMCAAWNNLVREMDWEPSHTIDWFSPKFSADNIEGALFILTKPRRYLFISGLIITILSSLLLLFGNGLTGFIQDPSRFAAFLFLISGILCLVCAPLNFPVLFKRKKKDSPRRPKR